MMFRVLLMKSDSLVISTISYFLLITFPVVYFAENI